VRARLAQRLIYAENQFLWSPEIAAVLAEKLAHPPCDQFRLVLLLPASPNNGADDTRGVLGELIEADGGHGRLVVSTLYVRANTVRDPIYVHAKIAIVDDGWLTLGSNARPQGSRSHTASSSFPTSRDDHAGFWARSTGCSSTASAQPKPVRRCVSPKRQRRVQTDPG
jgi:hypothetical protein